MNDNKLEAHAHLPGYAFYVFCSVCVYVVSRCIRLRCVREIPFTIKRESWKSSLATLHTHKRDIQERLGPWDADWLAEWWKSGAPVWKPLARVKFHFEAHTRRLFKVRTMRKHRAPCKISSNLQTQSLQNRALEIRCVRAVRNGWWKADVFALSVQVSLRMLSIECNTFVSFARMPCENAHCTASVRIWGWRERAYSTPTQQWQNEQDGHVRENSNACSNAKSCAYVDILYTFIYYTYNSMSDPMLQERGG